MVLSRSCSVRRRTGLGGFGSVLVPIRCWKMRVAARARKLTWGPHPVSGAHLRAAPWHTDWGRTAKRRCSLSPLVNGRRGEPPRASHRRGTRRAPRVMRVRLGLARPRQDASGGKPVVQRPHVRDRPPDSGADQDRDRRCLVSDRPDMSDAKKKELATRAALGPRLGHAKKGVRRVVAAPARPRATGVPSGVSGNGNDTPNG